MEFQLSQPKGKDGSGSETPPASPPDSPEHQPGWAKGLRQLYDSVVHEPLPDSFGDLLKKLDQAGND